MIIEVVMQQSGQQGEFSYTSEPRAAPMKGKGKYRNENEQEGSINIAADPRVVRGSTYAAKVSTGPANKTKTCVGDAELPLAPRGRARHLLCQADLTWISRRMKYLKN